ncbi:Disease resistance protein RPS2, putative [Ricinus communis]|uniref:Disease resistance protein RPS2, putative n=1 Tax=Ricinus communis TaxID=3988 RepID=B9S721_RICCO|nr:Disease resistance protein RPS2, putative [Ricinus communis]
MTGKAGKLHEWIVKCDKRVLLILDDVWEEVDFEAIGLPLRGDRKGYKIVLTSRKDDLCTKIGSQKNFLIDTLSKGEAWDLFRDMAGNSIDRILLDTASEIADECGGLPIAIVTLAKALKGKSKNIWNDVLLRLKNSSIKGILGMKNVYSRLELSFDLLESDEAKSCFLLCCLFPEDYNVPVEDLVNYGMGLGLFEDVQNIHQARDRVYTLIDELKGSSLLLEGDTNFYESVKMHDMVRDVAISIARGKHAYIVSCDSEMRNWPSDTDRYKGCTVISLLRKTIEEHPVDLECPKLQLLLLICDNDSQPLPNNFFGGMKELKVLHLGIPLLPQPLDVLKKLRTLHLHGLESGEISSIGALINLEILRIGTVHFRELPIEIGGLRNLRVLNLRGMSSLSEYSNLRWFSIVKDSENELNIEGDSNDVLASGISALLRNTQVLRLKD